MFKKVPGLVSYNAPIYRSGGKGGRVQVGFEELQRRERVSGHAMGSRSRPNRVRTHGEAALGVLASDDVIDLSGGASARKKARTTRSPGYLAGKKALFPTPDDPTNPFSPEKWAEGNVHEYISARKRNEEVIHCASFSCRSPALADTTFAFCAAPPARQTNCAERPFARAYSAHEACIASR
jgi:hypothetical protein